jgi:hypothetical protein
MRETGALHPPCTLMRIAAAAYAAAAPGAPGPWGSPNHGGPSVARWPSALSFPHDPARFDPAQSWRSATSGLTRAARRAGM